MTRYFADAAAKTLAVVRGDAVLLLPRSGWQRHDGLWEALGSVDPVAATLGVLTREGIADLTDFALVVGRTPGSLRVVVRGGFRVRTGAETVTAAGVSTWHERTIEQAAGFEVLAPFATAGSDASGLPIVEAVVPAVVLRRGELASAEASKAPTASADADSSAPVEPAAAKPAAEQKSEKPRMPQKPAKPAAPVPAEASTAPVFEAGAPAAPAVAPEHTLIPADDETIMVVNGRPVKPGATSAPAQAASAQAASTQAASAQAAPAPAAEPAPTDGDHDGLTVMVSEIQQMRRDRAAGPLAAGAPDAAASVAESRVPSLRVILPGGVEEPLTGEMVLGRSPSVNRANGGSLPRLVTLGVGDPDISRSHLRLALEGGTVVVTDLHSRNGSRVVQPGRPPVKLRAGEPTPVLAGTVVDLGGGWTIQVVSD